MPKVKYDENSIQVFKGLSACRKRPGMYVGDTGNDGFHHLLKEIIDNSLDEAMAGYAKNIHVILHKNGAVTVEDDGRGIPVENHPTEKISTLDVVMTILHAGGKFDNGDNSVFKTSSGLHGCGASVVNALSEWMEVNVYRDGHEYFRRYEKGEPSKKELEVLKKNVKGTGTKVMFKPDLTIFKNCKYFDAGLVENWLKSFSYLNPKVKFTLMIEETGAKKEFYSEKGLIEFIDYLTTGKKKLHKTVFIEEEVEKSQIQLAFVYDDGCDSAIESFANNVNTVEHGIHMNAALDALCKNITDVAKSLLKDTNLEPVKSDIQEGLTLVVSVKVQNPEFAGQTKTKLNNEELRKPFGDLLLNEIEKVFKKDRETANIIANKIVESMKARDAARKAKNLSRKKSSIDSLSLPGKLIDCSSKDPNVCELYICEGASASGTIAEARDRNFQAVLPLRGKVLNTYKVSLNKALENKEIGTIISALGVYITSRECVLDNLRYKKIIVAADGDEDGSHISCLLLTLFYKYMKKIIDEGYLYLSEPPLFKVVLGTQGYYLKDDDALEEFKEKHAGKNIEISRFKGLGEMNAEQLAETMTNPETRKIKQVRISEPVSAAQIVDCLMGEDVIKRKAFLNDKLYFGNQVI